MNFEVSEYTDYQGETERGIIARVRRHPSGYWHSTVAVRFTNGEYWVADWAPSSAGGPEHVMECIRARFGRVPDARPWVALFGALARPADYQRRGRGSRAERRAAGPMHQGSAS